MVSYKKGSELFQPTFPLKSPQTTPLKKANKKVPLSPPPHTHPNPACDLTALNDDSHLSQIESLNINNNRGALCTAGTSTDE